MTEVKHKTFFQSQELADKTITYCFFYLFITYIFLCVEKQNQNKQKKERKDFPFHKFDFIELVISKKKKNTYYCFYVYTINTIFVVYLQILINNYQF